MLNTLLSLYSLVWAVPTLLKYFGLMSADVVPLNANGTPWLGRWPDDTEPTYTKVKPEGGTAFLAAASCWYSFVQLFKK